MWRERCELDGAVVINSCSIHLRAKSGKSLSGVCTTAACLSLQSKPAEPSSLYFIGRAVPAMSSNGHCFPCPIFETRPHAILCTKQNAESGKYCTRNDALPR